MGVKAAVLSERTLFINGAVFEGNHGDLSGVPAAFGFHYLLKTPEEFEDFANEHGLELQTVGNIAEFKSDGDLCKTAVILDHVDYFGTGGGWSPFTEEHLFFYGTLFFQPLFFFHHQLSPHDKKCIEIGWHVRGGDVHQLLGDTNYTWQMIEHFRGWNAFSACFHVTIYYSNDTNETSFEPPPELQYFKHYLRFYNATYRINHPIHEDIIRLAYSDVLILSESSFSNVAAMLARSNTIILSPREKEIPDPGPLRYYQTHSIIKIAASGDFLSLLDRLLFETEMTSLIQHYMQTHRKNAKKSIEEKKR